MTFDRRELRAFLAVVDGGSLGRASERVHLSQPALSRLIHGMEARFGQPLFEREARGMVPTPAGEVLVPYARLLLSEMEMATDALEALRGVKRGVARIGAVVSVSRGLLPTSIGALLKVAPDLRVDVFEAPNDALMTALRGREIDLMIGAALPWDEDFQPIGEIQFDDVHCVFCSAQHPLASGGPPTVDQLLCERWVLPRSAAAPRVMLEQALRKAELPMPVISVEATSADAMITYVANTKLIGWLPRSLLATEQKQGTIHVFASTGLELHRRFFAYRRRRGLLPAAAAELLKVLPLVATPDQ